MSYAEAILCRVCRVPLVDHTDDMLSNCAVFDLSVPSSGATGASVPSASEAESAPGREPPQRTTRPGAPIAPGISVASVLMGWANDVKRELEELGADGPVGSMIPYHLDPDTSPEDLVGLLVSLRGISGDEDSGLIGMLRDLADDVSAALASVMDRKSETFAGMDVERHFGTSRKNWDREGIASKVAVTAVTKALTDSDITEPDNPLTLTTSAVVAGHLTDTFLKAFRLEPRAGALRALKIDPDLYCESEPGRPGVIVRVHKDTIE